MDEQLRFVRDAQREHFTMSELCARHGVSRRIGYKWLVRYDAEGRAGLGDRSHVPKHCAQDPAGDPGAPRDHGVAASI
jgi:putative transposase